MNWAIGQTYKNTEATRLDVTGLRVDLTHLETSVRGDIAKLTTGLDLRTSELRHDLGDAEVSWLARVCAVFAAVAADGAEEFDGRMITHGVWTDGMPKRAAFPVGRCAFGFHTGA
jgi:hypothetical protein